MSILNRHVHSLDSSRVDEPLQLICTVQGLLKPLKLALFCCQTTLDFCLGKSSSTVLRPQVGWTAFLVIEVHRKMQLDPQFHLEKWNALKCRICFTSAMWELCLLGFNLVLSEALLSCQISRGHLVSNIWGKGAIFFYSKHIERQQNIILCFSHWYYLMK